MEIRIENRPRAGLKGRFILMLVTGFCLSPLLGPVQAYDQYQYKMLLNPTEKMLEAESRGYIMIYDGLENRVVEKAMTEQFDRIENMMFVGTRYLQENGELLYEEDDCD